MPGDAHFIEDEFSWEIQEIEIKEEEAIDTPVIKNTR
jgi:hypothetical protein